MGKITAPQEEAFQSFISADRIKNSRSMCMLGAILFLMFAVIDVFAMPSALAYALLVRGIVIAGLMVGFVMTYQTYFDKYYDYIMSGIYLIAAFGTVATIYVALPEDFASQIYLATLLIVIMTIFAWSYFEFRTSSLLIAAIISSYAFVAVQKEMPIANLLVSIAFLIGAASIGYFSQHIRDSYLRQNFFLQQSLKNSVIEKTREADRNAFIANHDSLTGLPNRRYITALLGEMLAVAREKNKVMALMFLDLNGFKQVNDNYGHAAGDDVLKVVARRLELSIRKGDKIARLGGDEFLIGLLMKEGSSANLESIAEKFVKIVSQDMNIEGRTIQIGTSIGVAAYPLHGDTVDELLDIADKQMYKAKHSRKQPIVQDSKPEDSVIIFPSR